MLTHTGMRNINILVYFSYFLFRNIINPFELVFKNFYKDLLPFIALSIAVARCIIPSIFIDVVMIFYLLISIKNRRQRHL